MNDTTISPMTLDDYDELLPLWRAAEGVYIGEADTREGVGRYLERNPGLSLVARAGERLVGAVLCGHDGRRGLLHHLAVAPEWRRRGIARALVERCHESFKALGIPRCYIFVMTDNESGRKFWESLGWKNHAHALAMVREIVE